jgi:hypothetical protein
MFVANNRFLLISCVIVLALMALVAGMPVASGFTQSALGIGVAMGVPMGHEWITRMAAIELMGYPRGKAPDVPDPKDPRKKWTQGLAKNTVLSSRGARAELNRIKAHAYTADKRYASRYKAVYDVIIGERWVDIAGFNVLPSEGNFDAVAQEPADVQYDHFMRRYDDRGGAGGVNAAKQSRLRFINYFVEAAMAPSDQMCVYDGGAQASTAVQVGRNYFLFGRAAHLFQDSFSSEHTVRIPADNFTAIRQVKSYLCAAGSEQHTHAMQAVLDYSSGDVIWKPGTRLDPTWHSYKASNMKTTALVATEAMKDLWAAFIRVMGTPIGRRSAAATAEAETLVDNWLGYDEGEMLAWYDDDNNRDTTYVLDAGQTGRGKTVQECMTCLNVGTDNQSAYVQSLDAARKKILFNAVPWKGYEDLFDRQLHIWYAWRWLDRRRLHDPPPDWQIPDQAADTGIPVRIRSVSNRNYMSAPRGVFSNAYVYCRAGQKPLDFIMVGSRNDAVFRVAGSPWLFLSYTSTTGSVKLFDPYKPYIADPSNYIVGRAGPGWSLKSVYWKHYMWLKGDEPYITRTGNPADAGSQWLIEGLQ